MEKLDEQDLADLYELALARDAAMAKANVFITKVKAAEAEFVQKQVEVARKYKLRGKDAYDNDGVIHRGGLPTAPTPTQEAPVG